MYCPRCATASPHDAKFCRACGENLTLISQAASKFDEEVERRNELLRGEGYSHLFLALATLVILWEPISRGSGWTPILLILIVCLLAVYSLWNLLAYTRSKSLASRSAARPVTSQGLYCPTCAESNSHDAQFCRKCGQNLNVVWKAMKGRLPAALTKKLDEYVERTDRRIRNQRIPNAIVGAMMLFLGTLVFLEEYPSIRFGLAYVFFGSFFLSRVFWNWLYMRRSRSASTSMERASPQSTDDPLQVSPPSITEHTTELLETMEARDAARQARQH